MQDARNYKNAFGVVVFAAPEWPGRYLAVHLASKSGLKIKGIIFGPDDLENIAFRPRAFKSAARTMGLRSAIEAFLGFPYGIRHLWNRIFAPQAAPEIGDVAKAGVSVHRIRDYLSESTHCVIRDLAPDVLVICGTPILPESILSIARICTLNIHTSMLPHYRGGGSVFWPIFFKDFEKLGYTIHKAVPQVDAGPYLFQEAVPVQVGDTPEAITQRFFMMATPKLVQILQDTDLEDPLAWNMYEKPVRYAWRAPDGLVKQYSLGPTVPKRLAQTLKKVSHAIALNPYKASRSSGVAIFYWHRNLDPSTKPDDWRRVLGHPTTSELRERIELVRKHFDIVSLHEAIQFLEKPSPSKRTQLAVLTVDDGYRDFLTHLLPLLGELKAPCTFFVCTKAIENGTIWYQQVFDLIERIRGDRLFVPWVDRALWFGDVQHRVLTAEKVLNNYLKRVSAATRLERVAQLLSANQLAPPRCEHDRFCSVEDLRVIQKSCWVEMHLHSHAHHPFETLKQEELKDDITSCQNFFRSELGLDDRIISYPNGSIRAGQETILKDAGLHWGLTTNGQINRPGALEPFALKRIGLTNIPLFELSWNIQKALST